MNSTPIPSVKPGSGSATRLVQQILTARRELEAIDIRTREWIEAPPEELRRTFELNRQWFRTDKVFESSVFFYFDLSVNHEAVQRAYQIQRSVQKIVGQAHANPAPSRRLHTTIFTDVAAPHERLADEEVSRTADLYAHLYESVAPCLVFVLGPRLTPGGIILECRIHEPTLFAMRESARRLAGQTGRQPRIPTVEYATIGYVTGGDRAALVELYETLRHIRASCPPIAVPVDRVLLTLTVNKAIVPPTLEFELTAAPTVPRESEIDLSELTDPVEHTLLRESLRFANS